MKRFYLAKLATLVVLFLGCSMGAIAQVSTFTYSGAPVSYTVPAGVFSLTVDMQGAAGGNGQASGTGGCGGRVQGKLATTPGSVLLIYVGGLGASTTGFCCTPIQTIAGGYNGGGNGNDYGGGGGGASGIRTSGGTLTDRVVVAGGGGGGGYNCTSESGGAGGGYVGGNGIYCGGYNATYSGQGAQYNVGGAGASNGPSNPGTLGQGGNGYAYYYCAGGGGGYYGGGAGYYGAGGGGSSYGDTTLVTGKTFTGNYNCGANGSVTFTANCTTPVSGAVVGPSTICGPSGSFLYTDPTGTSGGVWSSSSTTVATIDPVTGIMTVTGIGSTNIVYTMNFVCGNASATLPVTVNPVANPITGSPVVCQFLTTPLTDGPGTWSSSNTGLATVSGTGVVTGVLPGNPVITYTNAAGCTATVTATVNAAPAPITGNFGLCRFATSQLSDASAGGVWSSANNTVATVGTAGLVSAVSVNPAVQTTTINYTFPGTGCKAGATVSVNPLPVAYVLYTSGASTYCAGTSGVPINLFNSASGINYQLYQNGSAFGSPVPGTGSGFTFGTDTAGTYTAIGTDGITGCTNNMLFNVVVTKNPTPVIETVLLSRSGNLCNYPIITYPDIIVHPSQVGVKYQAFVTGGLPATGLVAGTGSDLDIGTAPTAGTYTVVATSNVGGCQAVMSGNPVIIINSLPTVRNVTESGALNICPGAPGPHIGVDFSDPGIDYTLQLNGNPINTLHGASSALDFGTQPLAGNYTVIATNVSTGCVSTMNNNYTVTIYSLPAVFILSIPGANSYCSGGTGVDFSLSGSELNTNYQLYVGGSAVDTAVAGTASVLDMGFHRRAGTYTAIATNTMTGCSNNMIGSGTVTILPLPAIYNVMGGGPFCPVIGAMGSDIGLNGSDLGITYSLILGGASLTSRSGTGSAIDFGLNNVGTYTIVGLNPITSCTSNMAGSATVTTYPLPVAYNVMGGGNYCTGGSGVHISLDFSSLGVNYALLLSGTPTGITLPGSGASLDFGLITTTGTYTIQATNTATTCTNMMTGSAVVTNSAPPAIFTVVASGSSYCAGGTGVDISLSSSEPGVDYQLFNSGTPVGMAQVGTGLALDYGMITIPGNYTIVGTNSGSSCTSNMFGSAPLVINALPVVYTISGGGDFCTGGTGVHIGMSNSDIGIYYWLFNGMTAIGYVAGTGGPIDFGLQATPGTYQVVAVNNLTTCTNTMGGTAVINVKPLPNTYAVTGGGTYCAGGAGFNVGLGGSDVGINYQLYNGVTPVGAAIPGTNAAINFGTYTAAGTYTVMGSNIASGCAAAMTGSTAIGINPLPVAYTVYGGGAFCAGSPAAHVFLSGSAPGDNYQLYVGGVATGGTVTATGAYLDFGAQPAGGIYTVVSTDALTGCSANMTSSTSITVNPAPPVYALTGGGSYCAGGPGVHVGLWFSNAGISYQLYNGFTPVGAAKPGAGIALDFGMETGTGVYTAIGKDMVTGCTSNMTGSVSVSTMPNVTPTVSITTGTGSDTVCEGAITQFTGTPVYGGADPVYTWYVNGIAMISGDTFNYVPVNGDLVKVLMTSDYACVTGPMAMATDLMYVKPFATPSATLSINPGPAVCKGSTANYTVVPVNGGFTPSYTWLVNSNIVATNTLTYSNVPKDGDVVIFLLGSSYPCRLVDTVFSNTYKMAVDPGATPVVTIMARPGTLLQPGQNDTLTVSATNAGMAPTYQWSRNGANIPGATNATYISPYFYNNDSVSCEVTSSLACGLSSFNSVQIQVRDVSVNTIATGSDVRVIPNPNKGAFTVKGSVGNIDEEVSMEISNMLGQVVYKNKVMAQGGNINEQVQLGNTLANGMYLLNLRSGTETRVFHFVVEQ
jgi:hypothetical protein